MSEKENFTHLGENGNIKMVNVGEKTPTHRTAIAEARVLLPNNILDHFRDGDFHLKKGPVFQTAILAGIMAAKKTGDLIPLCHPLGLDEVNVEISLHQNEAVIKSSASLHGKTGVEMEALTAASVAALTIYDMCKALSHDIVIREIKLIQKTGGKRDFTRTA